MKRVISLLLSAIMLLSLCSVAASAEVIDTSDPEWNFYMLNQYVGWERLEEGYRFKRTDRTDKEEYLVQLIIQRGRQLQSLRHQDDLDKADYTEGAVYPDGMGWYYGIPRTVSMMCTFTQTLTANVPSISITTGTTAIGTGSTS